VALAECDDAMGREVNIGSGREISIGDLASMLIDMIDPSARIVPDDQRLRPKRSEVERLLCDNRLIRTLTGWEPTVSLEDGLAATVSWFRDPVNRASYKSHLYNV
jgi:nucleoside-diphosphate-sugar epimerase